MKLIILAIIVIAFCIFGLSFNIIFRKNGKFPDGEIAHNKALKDKGIECAKMEELRLWGKKKKQNKSLDCTGCNQGDCMIRDIKNNSKEQK